MEPFNQFYAEEGETEIIPSYLVISLRFKISIVAKIEQYLGRIKYFL